eukprot:6126659-Pyramimonas_sp.AAC.1
MWPRISRCHITVQTMRFACVYGRSAASCTYHVSRESVVDQSTGVYQVAGVNMSPQLQNFSTMQKDR